LSGRLVIEPEHEERGDMFFKLRLSIGCLAMATLWLPLSALGETAPVAPNDEVVVETNAGRMETVYRIFESSCRIAWTIYRAPVNEGIIRHEAKCDRTLDRQIPLIDKVLSRVLDKEGTSLKFRTLFMGTLGETPGLSARLALMAMQSPDWNPRKGRPKSGGINAFVLKLANRERLFGELDPLFRLHDRNVAISGVEKVFVADAGKLPFFAELKNLGVKATDKLPYDAMIWLSVTP
jgi:hypothetical protein